MGSSMLDLLWLSSISIICSLSSLFLFLNLTFIFLGVLLLYFNVPYYFSFKSVFLYASFPLPFWSGNALLSCELFNDFKVFYLMLYQAFLVRGFVYLCFSKGMNNLACYYWKQKSLLSHKWPPNLQVSCQKYKEGYAKERCHISLICRYWVAV